MNPRHLVFFALALAACGGPQECKFTGASTCGTGQVCEKVVGRDTGLCFAPVLVEGTVKVFGAAVSTPVAKAEVALIDANGAPASVVGTTDSDGKFSLRLPTQRSDASLGTLVGRTVTVRAAAQDYSPFPSLLRPVASIDSGSFKLVSGKATIVSGAQTELTLAPLSDSEKGRPGVSGTVELTEGQPVMVAVEGNGRAYTTAPDLTGAFHVFNVIPATGYKAQGYAKGMNCTAADANVSAGADTTGVSLKLGTGGTATISGTIQLATSAAGTGTSVVLALESSFDAVLARGDLVTALRAPGEGTNLTNSYSIAGIPDGKYVVLVGLENDGNVRDPDPAIAATQLTHLTVTGGVASANPVLRVVGATTVVSPGAGSGIDEVTGVPVFKWKPYTGATGYTLGVYTAQGVKTWERLAILSTIDADGNVALTYGGTTALKPGVLYQWRVTSYNLLTPISATEDLRGLFVVK